MWGLTWALQRHDGWPEVNPPAAGAPDPSCICPSVPDEAGAVCCRSSREASGAARRQPGAAQGCAPVPQARVGPAPRSHTTMRTCSLLTTCAAHRHLRQPETPGGGGAQRGRAAFSSAAPAHATPAALEHLQQHAMLCAKKPSDGMRGGH